jgi:hypothetical protein
VFIDLFALDSGLYSIVFIYFMQHVTGYIIVLCSALLANNYVGRYATGFPPAKVVELVYT